MYYSLLRGNPVRITEFKGNGSKENISKLLLAGDIVGQFDLEGNVVLQKRGEEIKAPEEI